MLTGYWWRSAGPHLHPGERDFLRTAIMALQHFAELTYASHMNVVHVERTALDDLRTGRKPVDRCARRAGHSRRDAARRCACPSLRQDACPALANVADHASGKDAAMGVTPALKHVRRASQGY